MSNTYTLTDVVNHTGIDPYVQIGTLTVLSEYINKISFDDLMDEEQNEAFAVAERLSFGKMDEDDQEFLKTLGINVQPVVS